MRPRATRHSPRVERLPAGLLGPNPVTMLEPPAKFKFPTPPNFQPIKTGSTELLLGFLDRQRRILELLAEARGIALDRIKITSQFTTLGATF